MHKFAEKKTIQLHINQIGGIDERCFHSIKKCSWNPIHLLGNKILDMAYLSTHHATITKKPGNLTKLIQIDHGDATFYYIFMQLNWQTIHFFLKKTHKLFFFLKIIFY